MNDYTRKRAIAVAKATLPQEVQTDREKNSFQHKASSPPRLSPSPQKHSRFSKRRLSGAVVSMESEAATGCAEKNLSSAASENKILDSTSIIKCKICDEEFYNAETYSVHLKIHSLHKQQKKGQQKYAQVNQIGESAEISDEIEIPNENGGNAKTVYGFNKFNLSNEQITGNRIVEAEAVREVEKADSKAVATGYAYERETLNNHLQFKLPKNKSNNFEFSNVVQNSQPVQHTKSVHNLQLIQKRTTKAPVPSCLGEIFPCSLV